MESWIIYLFKCSICLALLYLPFWRFLRKETFFLFNRYALLAITFLSFLLPLIQIPELTTHLAQQELLTIHLEEIQITINGKADSSINWMHILSLVYGIGAASCFLYKMYDLFRLIRFIPKGCLWVQHENGIQIHCHVHDVMPFSWMKHIVISQKDYEENGKEILTHEQAHIACGHSWDVLWLSLVEIVQWFNPFVWMLSKEIQDIHEYEADLAVLHQGVNARNYQLLIITKAVGSGSYTFANSFNHSSLKKRITMMMKEKSSPWARFKYLYLLPVAAICLIACTQNQKTAEKAEEATAVSTSQPETKVEKTAESTESVTEKTEPIAEKEVFQVCEEMPEYPGGMGELMKFLSKNIKYPAAALEKGMQGRVIVQFIVTDQGDTEEHTVVRGVDPLLDAEALRVLKLMPKWKPGKQRGKEVNVKYTVPVMFRLQ